MNDSTKNHSRLILIAPLLIGFLAGAAFTLLLTGDRLDELINENVALKLHLEEREDELARREERESQGYAAVSSLELVIEGIESETTMVAVKRTLKPATDQLTGRELRHLHPELVIQLFDRRIVEARQKEFRLELRHALLGHHTVIVLRAHERERANGGS